MRITYILSTNLGQVRVTKEEFEHVLSRMDLVKVENEYDKEISHKADFYYSKDLGFVGACHTWL